LSCLPPDVSSEPFATVPPKMGEGHDSQRIAGGQ
jgi:hypothetical protein